MIQNERRFKMNLANRTSSPLIFFITFLILFSGCAKDSNNPVISEDSDKYLWVHLNNDSVKIIFADLSKFSADGEEAIQLSSFVDTSLIHPYLDKNKVSYDSRSLYAYHIVGEDGFSASGTKGYTNNIWQHLLLGHILTSTRKVIFPDSKIDLAGAYDVKSTRHIYIHRKLDLAFTDSTHFVELSKITPVQVTNLDNNVEQAIRLSDVVANKVGNPGGFQYNIISLDNYGPTAEMSWEKFQTGYWLLTSEKTMFTDTSLTGGRYKVKVLEKIILK